MTQGQFLSGLKLVWHLNFLSPRQVAVLILKNPVCPTVLNIGRGKGNWEIHWQEVKCKRSELGYMGRKCRKLQNDWWVRTNRKKHKKKKGNNERRKRKQGLEEKELKDIFEGFKSWRKKSEDKTWRRKKSPLFQNK